MIEVVHISQHPDAVYIGRKFAGREASSLANPFRLNNKTDDIERLQVLDQYCKVLRYCYRVYNSNPNGLNASGKAMIKELMRLVELYKATGHLKLGCWCRKEGTNTPCHGDVIKQAIEGIIKHEHAARLG